MCRSRLVWCSCGGVEVAGSLSLRATLWCGVPYSVVGTGEEREEQGRAYGLCKAGSPWVHIL